MSLDVRERLFSFDQGQFNSNQGYVAGVDEAGRGPLAGPVVAAAVILLRHDNLERLNDSKKITPSQRQKLFFEIAKNGVLGIGVVDEKTIDQVNIYQATRIAMRRAILNLPHTPNLVLVDGNMTLNVPMKQKAVVRGDQKSAAIAAASIIAKVYRDAFMINLAEQYPNYLFQKHKGYPTKEHIQRIQEFGPSPVHRQTFAPVDACRESVS